MEKGDTGGVHNTIEDIIGIVEGVIKIYFFRLFFRQI